MDRIPLLTEILAQNPSDAFARYGLAMAFSEVNRTDEALEQFARLRVGSPDYVPAYQMAGQLLLRLNRTDDARETLTQGLQAAMRVGNKHAASEIQALLDDLPAM